jgi:predicted Ser/Thr protein kinase
MRTDRAEQATGEGQQGMNGAVGRAITNLNRRMTDRSRRPPIPLAQFLEELADHPTLVLRSVFQVLHDMVMTSVGAGVDEYPNDPESIHYVHYDCSRLFEENTERPFFADRLFANRLVNAVETLRRGAQQNKIYIFNGPPGCGKSTFLNNLLRRFEVFANSAEGMRYEVVWKLDPAKFGLEGRQESHPLLEKLAGLLEGDAEDASELALERLVATSGDGTLEIPCPSHDNPILILPRDYRPKLFEDLFGGSEFSKELFGAKEYDWVFREKPCTFCSSLYRTLLNTLKNAGEVHKLIYARPYHFNRRLGEGITVFNPGDPPPERIVVRNRDVQRRLNALLKNAEEVQYLYSRYAKTNNGVYALMDIKTHNTQRLIELHNIISEGVHKVEDIEENVNSLLLAVMNPEDQDNIKDIRSFSDRIEYIRIPYVMDINTEVKIYRHTFGSRVEERFLPRVLENFARVIISSRLNKKSEAMSEWIDDPGKYHLYCDENLQLLKMEIYTGRIPGWLTEEDRKALTARRRRRIIAESEKEGGQGISGRNSIKVFNDFYSRYAKHDKLINMSMLCEYFDRARKELSQLIPSGFLDSLLRMYNYTVLQEVKESLYYYNERQIARDILNYLFAVNFEPGTVEVCTFTKDKLEITTDFFDLMETRFLGEKADAAQRRRFRETTQREYTSRTLTQEMMVGDRNITQTDIYGDLRARYVQNLKEKSLDPFLGNQNFRRAIKDYDTKAFKTYDKRIREDVRYLMRNLQKKFGYTERGAREVCIYVIDNDLTKTFSKS